MESRPSNKNRDTKTKRPEAPHNTTQYIIDANTSCAEAPSLYMDTDRFGFDFQHHAMAGSMMDMMKNRFAQMYEQSTAATSVTELSNANEELAVELQESQSVEVPALQEVATDSREPSGVKDTERLVNFVDSGLETDFSLNVEGRDGSYDHYLRQAQNGENLQGLVQHLVTVLAQKDKEISSLKMQLSDDGR